MKTGLRLLVTLFVVLLANAQTLAETRLALVIGNSAYTSAPLANPVKDARLIAATLRGLGFEVLEHLDLDQKMMKRAIQDFGDRLEQAGKDAVGLFYYAGHGLQVSGVNYLIPVNANIQRERDVDIESVSANTVLAAMDYARNRLNFVILDACRNNPFARSFRSATNGLARMDAPRGTLIAYSTAPGRVALDGAGANSPYSSALAAAMQEQGLQVEQMFKNVRLHVMAQTKERQVPWESSSLTGDFYFSGAAAATPSPPAAVDKETVFWQSIEDSDDPAAYQNYLRKFPRGLFADLARRRIADLQQTSDTPPGADDKTAQSRKTTSGAAATTTAVAPAAEGKSVLRLAAALTAESAALERELYWRIYEGRAAADGKRKEIARSGQAKPLFELPPGQYHVQVEHGEASASADVTLADGATIEQILDLNAGYLQLASSAVEGAEELDRELYYRVYTAKKDLQGQRKEVARSGQAKPLFKLPAGEYYVTASHGEAEAGAEATVTAGELSTRRLALNVGYLQLRGLPAAGLDALNNGLYYRVYTAKKDLQGQRKEIARSGQAKPLFKLPAGKYHVTVSFGEALANADLEVGAGSLSEHELVLNAGLVKLAALPEAGAAPLQKGVYWTVYGARKDLAGNRKEITRSGNAQAQFTLPAGDYFVSVKHGDAQASAEVSIAAGEAREIKVLVAP